MKWFTANLLTVAFYDYLLINKRGKVIRKAENWYFDYAWLWRYNQNEKYVNRSIALLRRNSEKLQMFRVFR